MGSHAGCRKLLRHMSAYIDGELDPSLCRMIEAHSPKCKPCEAFISTLRKSVRILNKTGRRSRLTNRSRRDLRKKLKECSRSLKAGAVDIR